MGGKVVLGNWEYLDVEREVKAYAFKLRADYDEKRPLAFLPEGRLAEGVASIGATRAEIAEASGFSYSAVAGWFQSGRVLKRATVAESVFPALCEAHVRRAEIARRELAEARDAYLGGGELDEALRRSVELHVAAAVCTGELRTAEEAAREVAEGKESYRREVLRLAASFLDGDDLISAARVASAILASHTMLPSQREHPDELATCLEDMAWALWLDRDEELALLDRADGELDLLDVDGEGVPIDPVVRLRNGTYLMGDTAERQRLLAMSDFDFEFAKTLMENAGRERERLRAAVEYDSSSVHGAPRSRA